MAYSQDGMAAKHTGPGIAHYGSDFVSHGRLKTVNGTLGTNRLALLEGTFVKTFSGVGEEFKAFGARPVASMELATVEIYHDCDSSTFSGYAGAPVFHS
jgi:hypothetical protein